jgi:hypothetical protein
MNSRNEIIVEITSAIKKGMLINSLKTPARVDWDKNPK